MAPTAQITYESYRGVATRDGLVCDTLKILLACSSMVERVTVNH